MLNTHQRILNPFYKNIMEHIIVHHFDIEHYNSDLENPDNVSNPSRDPNNEIISKYLYTVPIDKKELCIDEDENFFYLTKFPEKFYLKVNNDVLYKTLTKSNMILSHNNTLKLILKTGFRKNFDAFGIKYNDYISNNRELKLEKILKK